MYALKWQLGFHCVHLTFLFNITFLAAILLSSMLLTLFGDMDNRFDSSLTKALHYPDIANLCLFSTLYLLKKADCSIFTLLVGRSVG